MKSALKEELKNSDACCVGVVRARIFDELRSVLEERGEVSLAEKDIEKRINPFLLVPSAKSIIVCLFSYFTGEKERISEYALGKDYHSVIKKRLSSAVELLNSRGFHAESFCDNSPLCDRYLAYLAGLGFFGKNGMLINEEYGSKVFIAYIITDCEIPEDSPLENRFCVQCGKCIEVCPGGAIGADFSFDENHCVSYLTQKKGNLSDAEKEIIKKSGYIWGCDICQNVCPYNYALKCTNIHEFLKSFPNAEDISENMSNKQFKTLFGDKAFAWRGKQVLLRNMEIFK